MKRVAIIGGGIAGLSAAYELVQQQRAGVAIDFTLFEATSRVGGIVETERRDGFVIECGPDSWITEKLWARELAVELGLADEIIVSNDQWRRTYLAEGGKLTPMPGGMRMMVPSNRADVLRSPLFSWRAKLAYLREPKRSAQLKTGALDAQAPDCDESVRDFTCRHFGAEVADTLAAPLLSGVFGGDIAGLSVRAVMPAFVSMEREHGSLILGLRARARDKSSQAALFTSLHNGLGSLIDRMEAQIRDASIQKAASIHTEERVLSLERVGDQWRLRTSRNTPEADILFDAVILATPAHTTASLLAPLDVHLPALLPQHASSAIIVGLAFAPEQARSLRIPRGFGFLVPQRKSSRSSLQADAHDTLEATAQRAFLACTFVDQKFAHRAPAGGVLLRGFFGGADAPALLAESDATLLRVATASLSRVLGKLPEPNFHIVRRWPRSLPLYAVGHLERMAKMEQYLAAFPGLRLVGNAYYGVGLPDLIRSGRAAAQGMFT